MIKREVILNVSKVILCKSNIILKSHKIILVGENKIELTQYDLSTGSTFRCFNGFVLIQDKEFGKIDVFNLTGDYIKTIEAGFNINIQKLKNKVITTNRNTKTYWELDEHLNLIDTGIYFQFSRIVSGTPIIYTKNEIKAFNGFNSTVKWLVDLTQFSRNIARHPKTGEVVWDKPNEIHERPLGDDDMIFVPLAGGQLVALDAETGEKVWIWEHHRTGTYQILGEYIYKQDGLSIIEINTSNGTLNREKRFNDDPMVDGFHASGPLWVYADVIIVCDVLYGKICILDRESLGVIEFFSLEKKLINIENAIAWHEGLLYVLDIDHTLHIFEKEK